MITCVGSVFLDNIIKIDSFPQKPIKVQAKGIEKRLGGPAAIASCAVTRLGVESDFVGRFGDDEAANFLKSELSQFGVKYNKSLTISGTTSSQSHIFEDSQGERLLAAYNDKKLLEDKSLPDLTFTTEQSFLVDIRWIEAAHYVAQMSQKNDIKCVADLDNYSNNNLIEGIVNAASHPVFSETGLFEFTKHKSVIDSLKQLYKKNNKFYAVTLGPEGVYWIDKGVIYHSIAPKIEAAETNGAGDVFHGAFATFLHNKKSIKDSIELATATASLKCTKSGGIHSIPEYVDLLNFSRKVKTTVETEQK